MVSRLFDRVASPMRHEDFDLLMPKKIVLRHPFDKLDIVRNSHARLCLASDFPDDPERNEISDNTSEGVNLVIMSR